MEEKLSIIHTPLCLVLLWLWPDGPQWIILATTQKAVCQDGALGSVEMLSP